MIRDTVPMSIADDPQILVKNAKIALNTKRIEKNKSVCKSQ
jgi:hypothetical protein